MSDKTSVMDETSEVASGSSSGKAMESFVQSLLPRMEIQSAPAAIARTGDFPGFGQIAERATLSSAQQGLTRLNTGDALTRVNGTETLVMPNGDSLTVSNRLLAMQALAPGLKVTKLNVDTGKYEPVAQLPSGFGQESSFRLQFRNGTIVQVDGDQVGAQITGVYNRGALTTIVDPPRPRR